MMPKTERSSQFFRGFALMMPDTWIFTNQKFLDGGHYVQHRTIQPRVSLFNSCFLI